VKKIAMIVVFALLAVAAIYQFNGKKGGEIQIGIVVPIEHEAMDRMVAGFRQEVEKEFGGKVAIDVQNAQGDESIQHAIIGKFTRQKYDLIVPIGTDVSMMVLHQAKMSPVLCLDIAADAGLSAPNATGLYEADIMPSIDFLFLLYPNLHKMTIVYSPSPKIMGQVERVKQLVGARGGKVQPIMIQTLPDLYSVSSAVDRDSELIFILKDHVVASGAAVLARVAERLSIPFITSDEGSVAMGATLAIGNSEEQIGVSGGELAIEILNGRPISELPMRSVEGQIVFVNRDAVPRQQVARFVDHYPVKFLEVEGSNVR
jgi:putative tryptophan/tyrosine transport system substrate-binding protein